MIDLPDLTQVNSKSGRYYVTPEGRSYPSVTSVTGLASRDAIASWRKRVGEAEANKITTRASKRGSAIHYLCEQYLKTGKCTPGAFDLDMFKSLQPVLDELGDIDCIEQKLYSDHLECAGTVDLIAKYEGRRYIIDFKTSAKPKKREWCSGYFMQCAAYAVMFEERTHIPVDSLMIIMGVDNEDPIIMKERRDDWVKPFLDLRKQYKDEKGI